MKKNREKDSLRHLSTKNPKKRSKQKERGDLVLLLNSLE